MVHLIGLLNVLIMDCKPTPTTRPTSHEEIREHVEHREQKLEVKPGPRRWPAIEPKENSIQSWHRCLVLCHHLISLLARASTSGGIARPICFAVLRFITSSNFVGCSTGRSAGLAPFRILST